MRTEMVEISSEICSEDWREFFMKQSVDKFRQINFCNICEMCHISTDA